MTYEVQQTRWDRIIRRVSGSIGPGSRVSETISELFPMLDVERVPGELLLLGGTSICHGGGTIAGAAGEAPTAQLFNPLDSGNLVTLTAVRITCDAITTLRWGTGVAVLGTAIGTQVFRDTRLILPALPVGQVRQRSAVALATATNQVVLPANTLLALKDPNDLAVLAPGTGFEIGSSVNTSRINYSFYWRERPAEQSELSL